MANILRNNHSKVKQILLIHIIILLQTDHYFVVVGLMALSSVLEGETDDKVIGFETDYFVIGSEYLEPITFLSVLLPETNDIVIGIGRF